MSLWNKMIIRFVSWIMGIRLLNPSRGGNSPHRNRPDEEALQDYVKSLSKNGLYIYDNFGRRSGLDRRHNVDRYSPIAAISLPPVASLSCSQSTRHPRILPPSATFGSNVVSSDPLSGAL